MEKSHVWLMVNYLNDSQGYTPNFCWKIYYKQKIHTVISFKIHEFYEVAQNVVVYLLLKICSWHSIELQLLLTMVALLIIQLQPKPIKQSNIKIIELAINEITKVLIRVLKTHYEWISIFSLKEVKNSNFWVHLKGLCIFLYNNNGMLIPCIVPLV